MEIRWLQDFLALAEGGNFTRAAAARHASQAAFSRRIQSLEAWVGASLVDRTTFPARLTPEGERFRERAARLLAEALEARAEAAGLGGDGGGEPVRVALPFALATASLPGWWSAWGADLAMRVVSGNVHDMLAALAAEEVDVAVCFHDAQAPIQLDPRAFERLVLGRRRLAPYAAPALLASGAGRLPGSVARPVPLLLYPPGVYFGRLVEAAIENAPARLHARRVLECDMSDVLREMAREGHGVAWLVEDSVPADGSLVPAGGDEWAVAVEIVAFRVRAGRGAAAKRLWARLAAGASERPAPRGRNGESVPGDFSRRATEREFTA